jgi:hypothetical protein
MRLLLLSFVIACGGGSSGPAAVVSGPPAAMVAPGAAPDDTIVATVNGRPVWGSCVAIQARRDPKLTRAQALDQCVSFELLAQEAEQRQLATFPEVVDATRTALVSRLVDQFAAKYPDHTSMTAEIDTIYQTQTQAVSRPELRASSHVVFKKKDALADKMSADELAQAKALADQLHATLAIETGLLKNHLADAVKTIAVGPALEMRNEDLPPVPRERSGFDEPYVAALFAIPEVGRVSPVTRTSFGYHVILLTELTPAEMMSREQLFAMLRTNQFIRYVSGLMKTVDVETHPELLE